MVYRLHAFVDKSNGAKHLYEVLLPYLNNRPLASNVRPSESKAEDLRLDTEDDLAAGAPMVGAGGAGGTTNNAMGSMVDAFGSLGADSDDDDDDDGMMGFGGSSSSSKAAGGSGGADPFGDETGDPFATFDSQQIQKKKKNKKKSTPANDEEDLFSSVFGEVESPSSGGSKRAGGGKKKKSNDPFGGDDVLQAENRGAEFKDLSHKAEWRTVPRGGDISLARCALEAFHFMLRTQGLTRSETKHVHLLMRWTLMRMLLADLSMSRKINSAEVHLVKTACRQLSYAAAKQAKLQDCATSADDLMNIKRCINNVETATNKLFGQKVADKSTQPDLDMEEGRVPSTAIQHPLFGRLRCDYDVENLAGSAPKPPILRPVELTLVANKVKTFNDVANALRHCVHLCTLMAYQTDTIKNTYMLRASLIVNMFTDVIPLPLPLSHPRRKQQCFWMSQQMRYETQTDILRMLNLVCRHFCTASLSLKVSRSFDASRILCMACMVCVADAVMRITACDIPSALAQHYAGTAEGQHIAPFGIEMRSFADDSQDFQLLDPNLAIVRTQVLDYFYAQQQLVRDDHFVFAWEHSMDVGPPEEALLDQLCLQIGFERGHTAEYITGQRREVMDNYPELGFFRDIVFILKVFMVPTSDALPDIRAWMPTDAQLQWDYKRKKVKEKTLTGTRDVDVRYFVVKAFERKLKTNYKGPRGTTGVGGKEPPKSILKKIQELFSTGHPRAPPSGANPSNLVGTEVETEDDILHIRKLPDFNGAITQQNSELLLQFLTVPYLRIPLVLQFFASQEHTQALNEVALQ